MQLEALIREYHNTDMKPGKHATNVRLEVNELNRHLRGGQKTCS